MHAKLATKEVQPPTMNKENRNNVHTHSGGTLKLHFMLHRFFLNAVPACAAMCALYCILYMVFPVSTHMKWNAVAGKLRFVALSQ